MKSENKWNLEAMPLIMIKNSSNIVMMVFVVFHSICKLHWLKWKKKPFFFLTLHCVEKQDMAKYRVLF